MNKLKIVGNACGNTGCRKNKKVLPQGIKIIRMETVNIVIKKAA